MPETKPVKFADLRTEMYPQKFSRIEFSWADPSGRVISGRSDTRTVNSDIAQDTLVVPWFQGPFQLADGEFKNGRHDFVHQRPNSLKSESPNFTIFFI
jgi:hypothetical protein